MTKDSRSPARNRQELYCPVCGWADRVTTGALLRFTKEGWPKCCGETMALRDSEQPGAANTDFDLQPLRDQEV